MVSKPVEGAVEDTASELTSSASSSVSEDGGRAENKRRRARQRRRRYAEAATKRAVSGLTYLESTAVSLPVERDYAAEVQAWKRPCQRLAFLLRTETQVDAALV